MPNIYFQESFPFTKTNKMDVLIYRFRVLKNLNKLYQKTNLKINYEANLPKGPKSFKDFLKLEIMELKNNRTQLDKFKRFNYQNISYEARKMVIKNHGNVLSNDIIQKMISFKTIENVRKINRNKLSHSLRNFLNRHNIQLFENPPNPVKLMETFKKMQKFLNYKSDRESEKILARLVEHTRRKFDYNNSNQYQRKISTTNKKQSMKFHEQSQMVPIDSNNNIKVKDIAQNDYLKEYCMLYYEISTDNKYYENFFKNNLKENPNLPKVFENIQFYYPNFIALNALKELEEFYNGGKEEGEFSLNPDQHETRVNAADIICPQLDNDKDMFKRTEKGYILVVCMEILLCAVDADRLIPNGNLCG